MSSKKKRARNVGWDCSVCTFKNAAEAFKCAMCDIRKGTSTRKPRLNSTIVEQQETVQRFVQKQQLEALAQAQKEAKLKSADTSRTDSRSDLATPTPSLSDPAETPSTSASGGSKRTCAATTKLDGSEDASRPDSTDSSLSAQRNLLLTSPTSPSNNLNSTRSPTPNSVASGSRLIFAPRPPPPPFSPAVQSGPEGKSSSAGQPPPIKRSKLSSSQDSNGCVGDSAPADPQSPSASATSIASPPVPVSHKRKISRPDAKPDATNQRTPPQRNSTAAGNGTPKSRLKNIDKNSARNLAVTVDGLTVVITDFKVKPPRNRQPKPPPPPVVLDVGGTEEGGGGGDKLNDAKDPEEVVQLDDTLSTNVEDEKSKVEAATDAVVVQMLNDCHHQQSNGQPVE